jgi:hypothetical protein
MATFTLKTDAQKFPDGTSVGAYPASAYHPTARPSAASGSPTASATVTNGTASFSGLADDTAYVFGATVSGQWRFVRGRTVPAGTDPSTGADEPAGSGVGTLAARPAASAVSSGYLYFASDDNGGTLYRSDASTWTKVAASVTQPGGAELGYAEITSSFAQAAVANNTILDVPGLSTTVTVGSRPILVMAFISQLYSSSVGQMNLRIYEGTTMLTAAVAEVSTASRGDGVAAMVRLAPSAGSHTYKASILKSAGTTPSDLTAIAGGILPAFIRVVEG